MREVLLFSSRAGLTAGVRGFADDLLALGRTEPSAHADRGLVAYLRREATAVFDNAELTVHSRSWLVDHDYLLPRERDIRRLIAARCAR